jgi:hypothetical protein
LPALLLLTALESAGSFALASFALRSTSEADFVCSWLSFLVPRLFHRQNDSVFNYDTQTVSAQQEDNDKRSDAK